MVEDHEQLEDGETAPSLHKVLASTASNAAKPVSQDSSMAGFRASTARVSDMLNASSTSAGFRAPSGHFAGVLEQATSIVGFGASIPRVSELLNASVATAGFRAPSSHLTSVLQHATSPSGLLAPSAHLADVLEHASSLSGLLAPSAHLAGVLEHATSLSGFRASTARVTELLNASAATAGFRPPSATFSGIVGNAAQLRFATLELGLNGISGTGADAFSPLRTISNSKASLQTHIKSAVAHTQTGAAFGFDYRNIQSDFQRIDHEIRDDPDLDREIRTALEPIQELTGLTDEQIIDYGEFFGWWRRVKAYRVSSGGLILGFTVALASYVFGEGSGMVAAPSAAMDAMILGGGIYAAVDRLQQRD